MARTAPVRRAVGVAGGVSALEADPVRESWPPYRPSVDSDGLRFAVGYHELYANNTSANDLDAHVTLIAVVGSSLVAVERGVGLATSGNREFNVQVASKYAGSGQYQPGFCATHDRDDVGAGHAIDAHAYRDASNGTFQMRPTGCGGISIQPAGNRVPGGYVSFYLTSSALQSGLLVGLPVHLPIPGCPGCVLGVNGTAFVGTQMSVLVPLDPRLLGATLAVQGFGFDFVGACLGHYRLSDTVDVTIL